MEKEKLPKTKEECFALLDKKLSEEDKQFLIEDKEAAISVHFTLGLWIRNNWLYSMNKSATSVWSLPGTGRTNQ